MTTLGTVSVASLARWVEGRIDLTIGFTLTTPVVYGVDLIDPDLLDDPEAPAARLVPFAALQGDGHDGTVVVINEWLAPPTTHRRPGDHQQKRRARQVHVHLDGMRATVTRWEHDPDVAVLSLV
jgi:hypothetical protein